MKKIVLLVFALCSLSFGIRIGTLELSPELGGGVQKLNADGKNHYEWSVYGKVWMGAGALLIAPQFKYSSLDDGYRHLKNWQYGGSLGASIDLAILYVTPYIGANYSRFNEYYKNTVAYNAGIRAKPMFLPYAVSVEYQYQKPESYFGTKRKMESLLFSLGLTF